MTGCSSLYAPAVAKFEYDEEASAALRLDVVHDVRQDKPVPVTRWIEAMRRLNAIRDPLARQILVLDRECGSGTGACDNADDVVPEIADRLRWGCKTTEVIAASFRCRVPRGTCALNALDPVTPRSTRSSPSPPYEVVGVNRGNPALRNVLAATPMMPTATQTLLR
jgi:hypothetical protein